MPGRLRKMGQVAMGAAVAVGLGSPTALASGWDPQYAMFGEGGQCEQFKIRINDMAVCTWSPQGKVCDYKLQFGNTTKGYAQITLTLNSQLPPGYQLLLPNPRHTVSLKPYHWEIVKVLRTSAQKPPTAALVGIDCALAMP